MSPQTSPLVITRPDRSEYASFSAHYIDQVQEDDILKVLARQTKETLAFYRTLTEQQAGHRYAPGKWSIKEVIGHLSDTERIWAYRALRFARNDAHTALPSFTQDDYVAAAQFDRVPTADLIEHYELLRRSNLLLFQQFDQETWMQRGTASGAEFTVRAFAYMIAGHERWHLKIVRERYL